MNNFLYNLKNIEKRFSKFRNRNEIMEKCINDKLYISLELYNAEVDRLCEYLLSRSNYKVLKYISKG